MERITNAMQAYSDYYVSGPGYYLYHGVELSLVDTHNLDPLMESSSPIIQQLLADRSRPDTHATQTYCAMSNYTIYTECFDMQHLFFTNLSDDEYASWLETIKAAVPANWLSDQWFTSSKYTSFKYLSDKDNTAGLSIFVPSEYYSSLGWTENYKRLQWAQDTGFDHTGW